jgi:hypothetical protein
MGDDFTNHQAFVGSEEPEAFRTRLIARLRQHMAAGSYVEVEDPEAAARGIAVGPVTGRWICIYDSAGNGDWPDPDVFEALALDLSHLTWVVDIHMDDSAAVYFYLYQNGRVVDRFANSKSVVERWETGQEAAAYRGRPELWTELLPHPGDEARLRAAWQSGRATQILPTTAAVLGWHPQLCEAGFTIDYDGIPIYYKEHWADDPVELSRFDEYQY